MHEATAHYHVYVHKTIANYRVAKRERNKDQRTISHRLHYRSDLEVRDVRDQIQQCKRQPRQPQSPKNPFELLAEQWFLSTEKRSPEKYASDDQEQSAVGKFDFAKSIAPANERRFFEK